jgi:hypothetical protein
LSDPSIAAATDDTCGWSIRYNPDTDGYLTDCAIYTGVKSDCDITKATKVGAAYIYSNFLHFCFGESGFEASNFYIYGGKCIANDSGKQAGTSTCDTTMMSENALSVQSYPLVRTVGEGTVSYTFKATDPINTNVWGKEYTVFPLSGPNFLTASCCIAPQSGSARGTMPTTTANDVLALYGDDPY